LRKRVHRRFNPVAKKTFEFDGGQTVLFGQKRDPFIVLYFSFVSLCMPIVFCRAFVLPASRSFLLPRTRSKIRQFSTIMPSPTEWIHVPASGGGETLVPSYSVFTKPIERSQQDDRDYRLIRLENGLEALLVHDAKADKAAASLDVSVGHLADPVSRTLELRAGLS
jgi:hypothetical protein